MSSPPVVVGIYSAEDESDPEFRDSVPCFDTKEECLAWLKTREGRVTNPAYSQCKHIFTHACDWGQVCRLILEPLSRYRTAYPPQPPASSSSSARPANVFASEPAILSALTSRLDLPFHRCTNEESTLNTLRYLFFHMRHGIFVLIRRNRLLMFAPFVNKDYVNTWGDELEVEGGGSMALYLARKKGVMRAHGMGRSAEEERYMPSTRSWWANGNIICNVASPDFWGDAYLPQLKHMLLTLCAQRTVPDCEFFINKRDFPQLKRNLTEPYDFLYDADDAPLPREAYASYAPIASFFVGAPFADLPLVCTDDWETATGKVFPPSATDLRSARNRGANTVPWAQRTPTAFFRGNATGAGVTPETNQRLRLAQLSGAWNAGSSSSSSSSSEAVRYGAHAGNAAGDGVAFLDAGVVGWNKLRDRKMQGQPMTFLNPDSVGGVQLVKKVPMYMQSKYKYQIYVDGHCAAMRYASMMPLGSLILKVGPSSKADSMWYFPLLVPYDWKSAAGGSSSSSSSSSSEAAAVLGDHIAVAADLSDLGDAILWAKTHDSVCQAIVANATALYTRLIAQDGQLDYLALMCSEISRRFTPTQQGQAGAGGAGAAAAAAAAAALPLLLPALASVPPGASSWFDPCSAPYASVHVGSASGSSSEPPCLRALATEDCACPRCQGKQREHRAAHAAGQAMSSQLASGMGEAAAFETARAQARLVEGGGGSSGSSSSSSGSSSSSSSSSGSGVRSGVAGGGGAPAAPTFGNLSKAKEAAQKAAALAKQREAQAGGAGKVLKRQRGEE